MVTTTALDPINQNGSITVASGQAEFLIGEFEKVSGTNFKKVPDTFAIPTPLQFLQPSPTLTEVVYHYFGALMESYSFP